MYPVARMRLSSPTMTAPIEARGQLALVATTSAMAKKYSSHVGRSLCGPFKLLSDNPSDTVVVAGLPIIDVLVVANRTLATPVHSPSLTR